MKPLPNRKATTLKMFASMKSYLANRRFNKRKARYDAFMLEHHPHIVANRDKHWSTS